MGSAKPDIPLEQLPEDGGPMFHKTSQNNPATPGHEIIMHDEGNPRSLENMLTGQMKTRFNEIPAHYFGMDEKQISAMAKPSELEDQIRQSFWDEYFMSQDNLTTIDTTRVYGRLCTRDYFYKTIINVPVKYAYMLLPPPNYVYRMRSLLELGHKRLRQILEMPLKDGKNQPNIKLISEVVKIVNMLENRVNGSVTQNINVKQQSKNLNVNVHQGAPPQPKSNELDIINREIEFLQKQQALPQPDHSQDVTPLAGQQSETITVTAKKA